MSFHHPALRALGIAFGILSLASTPLHAAALEEQPCSFVTIKKGDTAFSIGDYARAISRYQVALLQLRQQLGDDDSKVVALYNRLGPKPPM